MSETAENKPALLKNEKGATVNVNQLLDQIKKAEVGMEVTSDYHKFEDGVENRLVFIEMVKMPGKGTKQGELVDCVKFIHADDGRYKKNADAVFVSYCQELESKGKTLVPLTVTSKGKIQSKSGGGEYSDLTISDLILPAGN